MLEFLFVYKVPASAAIMHYIFFVLFFLINDVLLLLGGLL